MSTTTDRNDIVFQCDEPGCGETLAAETSNFDSARNLLRRAGWKPIRDGNGWKHKCRDCQKGA